MNRRFPTSSRPLVQALACALAATGLPVAAPALASDAGDGPSFTWYLGDCNDSGTGTLRHLVTLAGNSDTIDISACSEILLESSISIGQPNLTLVGKSAFPGTILDGQGVTRPLQHLGDGLLTLRNVAVRNGYFSNGVARGGCISSLGLVKLIDSQAKYCTAQRTSGSGPVRGGAIYAVKDVYLEHSTISHNEAVNFVGGGVQGGGVHAGGHLHLVDGSRLESNSALIQGGPSGDVAAGGGAYARGIVTLEDSTISGNTVKSVGSSLVRGGGIANTPGASPLLSTVRNMQIIGNKATGGTGGGLFLESTLLNLKVEASTIADNEAEMHAGIHANINTSIDITDSTFARNQAANTGGALSARASKVKIANSTFHGNTALRNAGASIGVSGTQPAQVEQSTFTHNHNLAPRTPGAGIVTSSNIRISNSTISGNTTADSSSASPPAGSGLALHLIGSVTAELTSSIIADNHWRDISAGSPGVIYYRNIGGQDGPAVTGTLNVIGASALPIPAGNVLTDAPRLQELADHGGPTLVMMPRPDSPALDAGYAAPYLGQYDQRGAPYWRMRNGHTDIGSVEYDSDRIFYDGFVARPYGD